MGIKVIDATASNSSEVQAATESLVGRVDAISVLTDNTAVSALESIIKVGEQNKIPVIAGDTDSVKRGAVAAYAFDYKDLGKQAGYQAAEILSGTADQGHPGRVRQGPPVVDQREGRGGDGRHDPRRPHDQGAEQVLSRR